MREHAAAATATLALRVGRGEEGLEAAVAGGAEEEEAVPAEGAVPAAEGGEAVGELAARLEQVVRVGQPAT